MGALEACTIPFYVTAQPAMVDCAASQSTDLSVCAPNRLGTKPWHGWAGGGAGLIVAAALVHGLELGPRERLVAVLVHLPNHVLHLCLHGAGTSRLGSLLTLLFVCWVLRIILRYTGWAGKPAGSATPLLWSASAFMARHGRVLENLADDAVLRVMPARQGGSWTCSAQHVRRSAALVRWASLPALRGLARFPRTSFDEQHSNLASKWR